MSVFTKIGCVLIGWDAAMLAECGEASKRQFRKILSAIIIMMLLWGTIGFCFAQNYMNIESVFGKMGVAIAFMVIILCIERVIILTVGRNILMALSRGLLALCMALLGASIFDQLIFKNDIQQQISENREVQRETIRATRLIVIEDEISRLTAERDSLAAKNEILQNEVNSKPTILIVTTDTKQIPVGTKDDNTTIIKPITSVSKTEIPNPKFKQIAHNDSVLGVMNANLKELVDRKLRIDEEIGAEINSRPTGFIEELNATINMISSSRPALVFYFVMFLFLMFLELFVLTIKMGDKKCDYDLMVEHQLLHSEKILQRTQETLSVN